MPSFIRAFGGNAFLNDTADVTADGRGASLWLPPGVEPDAERMVALLETHADERVMPELMGVFEQMGRFHPTEPHWYLPLIGVDPACQGQGLGGALMRHAVERCDRDGLPAYLESSNPRNITLYQRHGFEILGRIQVGTSPVMTPMYRKPR
jgi:ribosomal protein S18 acetylase RimI-like enzyme